MRSASASASRYASPGESTRSAPWQHPEKAVPLFTINALRDRPLPVYGRGEQRRDRLHVDDHCSAILTVLEDGRPGEIYNVSAGNNRDNLTVARAVCARLGKPESLIEFVEDRPGHDWDYVLDSTKLRGLGWAPQYDFQTTLNATVDWYAANEAWWGPLVEGEFKEVLRNPVRQTVAQVLVVGAPQSYADQPAPMPASSSSTLVATSYRAEVSPTLSALKCAFPHSILALSVPR